MQRVDREYQGKQNVQQQQQQQQNQQQIGNHLLLSQYAIPQEQCSAGVSTTGTLPQHTLNIDIAMQRQQGVFLHCFVFGVD